MAPPRQEPVQREVMGRHDRRFGESVEGADGGQTVDTIPGLKTFPPHHVAPDQVLLTTGLIILTAPFGGRMSVLQVWPGQQVPTRAQRRGYQPGACCLCQKDDVFLPLWEGPSKNRRLFRNHVPVGREVGVELPGNCRLAFCAVCWEKWGTRFRCIRVDHHDTPCCCGVNAEGDAVLCDTRLRSDRPPEPCALLAYRSCADYVAKGGEKPICKSGTYMSDLEWRSQGLTNYAEREALWKPFFTAVGEETSFKPLGQRLNPRLKMELADSHLIPIIVLQHNKRHWWGGKDCVERKLLGNLLLEAFENNQTETLTPWAPPSCKPNQLDWITTGSFPPPEGILLLWEGLSTFKVFQERDEAKNKDLFNVLSIKTESLWQKIEYGPTKPITNVSLAYEVYIPSHCIMTEKRAKATPVNPKREKSWLQDWRRRAAKAPTQSHRDRVEPAVTFPEIPEECCPKTKKSFSLFAKLQRGQSVIDLDSDDDSREVPNFTPVHRDSFKAPVRPPILKKGKSGGRNKH